MTSILARLLDIFLPSGGYAVQLVEAFFDEMVLTKLYCVVCCRIYHREGRLQKISDEDWHLILEEWNLPFFRMSACANNAPPFDMLCKDQKIEIETRAIELIWRETLGASQSPWSQQFTRTRSRRR